MPVCDECGTEPAVYEGRCWVCQRARTHAALADLIRTADSIIRNAEAAKQAALDAQWLLCIEDHRERPR